MRKITSHDSLSASISSNGQIVSAYKIFFRLTIALYPENTLPYHSTVPEATFLHSSLYTSCFSLPVTLLINIHAMNITINDVLIDFL